ncbi:MAG: hypothetical protein QXM11_02010 [Candidatus Aenigmatarchaeota archaeon]
MVRSQLDPKILKKLVEKTGMEKNVIRVRLSQIRRKHPSISLNAAAYIFAQQHGFSFPLSEEDRKTLGNIKLEKVPVKIVRQRKQIINIAEYETSNNFLKEHITEINKTYSYGCYTACFVLMRKVLENLIIEILRKKYPQNKKEHKKMYFDFNRKRNHDFNILLQNLRNNSKDFETEKKLVERICQLCESFKETANEMAHSLYHIATKKEIDNSRFQDILNLIKELHQKHFGESK